MRSYQLLAPQGALATAYASKMQCFSQMESDLRETFGIGSWRSSKMIQYVKYDTILQVSSQEPSTPSKYGLWGQGVLDTFKFML